MKTLYIECNMGAAGDMLMSALLELHPNPDDFMDRLYELNLPNVSIVRNIEKKCGITGTHIRVYVRGEEENEHIYDSHEHSHEHSHSHSHSHSHRSVKDIEHIIFQLALPFNVHNDVMAVYALIAEAESKVHNQDISDIHFHEVGTMDAITDIVGVCSLIDELGVDEIVVSPVNVGKGSVKCAHGTLPVPAPATAYILRDVPIYGNNIDGELCTPTGAALLKHFASRFATMPVMKVEKIGYGMGSKNFEVANCVRAFLGETSDSVDRIVELKCNLDDMTGEKIGFATDRLFDGGALDVFTTPIGMKKNRPAILLTCICREADREKMISLMFKHTTTIGIRESLSNRYVLDRCDKTVNTNYGEVRVKRSSGYGVVREKAEYDDLERIAVENGIDISEIRM